MPQSTITRVFLDADLGDVILLWPILLLPGETESISVFQRTLCIELCIFHFECGSFLTVTTPAGANCLFLPLFRLNVIFSKFDEVQRSGNMVLSPVSGKRTCPALAVGFMFCCTCIPYVLLIVCILYMRVHILAPVLFNAHNDSGRQSRRPILLSWQHRFSLCCVVCCCERPPDINM